MSALLIASLGQEPQVVTLALDELLRQGEDVRRVVVVHTAPEIHLPLQESLKELYNEFEMRGYYRGKVSFSSELLTASTGPLQDIVTEDELKAAFASLYQLIRHYKRSGVRIHLSIAGGRKTLGLFAFSVAQLLFDKDDHVWHLVSDEELRKSRRLHASPHERVSLIDVPFIQWSNLPGMVRGEFLGEEAEQALIRQAELQKRATQQQARAFLYLLTPAERELLHILMRIGGSNKELAKALNKSPKTVGNQLASIYQKFASFYELTSERIDRSQLMAVLGSIL